MAVYRGRAVGFLYRVRTWARLSWLLFAGWSGVSSADTVYYWAWGTNLVNAQSCTTATPHNTCSLDPHGAATKRMTNIGGVSWKGAGAVCGADGTYSTGPTGIANGAYTLSSTWSGSGCTGSNMGAVTVYRSNVSCDTTDPTAPCYIAPFNCTALANVRTLGAANDQPDGFMPGDTICVKSATIGGASQSLGGTGCAAFKTANQKFKRLGPSGARDWLVQYQFTGLNCDTEPEQTATPVDDSDAEKCQTGAGGLTWCESKNSKPNCGYFNDKYLCLETLGADKCFTQSDGKRLCVETAPTPPVPDNGTPGVKATPNDSMQVCTGVNACTQYNYYNSATTGGSSRPTGSGGNTDGSGTVGPGGASGGTGTGEDGGDSSASGGEECDAPPVCVGDPVQCAILRQQWKNRCVPMPTSSQLETATGLTAATSSEWVQGDEAGETVEEVNVGSLSNEDILGSGGGECPADITVNLSMTAVTIPLSQLCSLLTSLGYLVMAGTTLYALRIVMGTPKNPH